MNYLYLPARCTRFRPTFLRCYSGDVHYAQFEVVVLFISQLHSTEAVLHFWISLPGTIVAVIVIDA